MKPIVGRTNRPTAIRRKAWSPAGPARIQLDPEVPSMFAMPRAGIQPIT